MLSLLADPVVNSVLTVLTGEKNKETSCNRFVKIWHSCDT